MLILLSYALPLFMIYFFNLRGSRYLSGVGGRGVTKTSARDRRCLRGDELFLLRCLTAQVAGGPSRFPGAPLFFGCRFKPKIELTWFLSALWRLLGSAAVARLQVVCNVLVFLQRVVSREHISFEVNIPYIPVFCSGPSHR